MATFETTKDTTSTLKPWSDLHKQLWKEQHELEKQEINARSIVTRKTDKVKQLKREREELRANREEAEGKFRLWWVKFDARKYDRANSEIIGEQLKAEDELSFAESEHSRIQEIFSMVNEKLKKFE
jgi:hypothetical protein